MTEADVPAIAAILAEPAVARWWGRYDADRVRAEMLGDPRLEVFVIEIEGAAAGVVYVSEESDPDYRHASLDISLATAHHGQGYGREALRVLIEHLISERGHHRFTIDPEVANEVAIRSYSAVGFKPVGIMRQYSRRADGTWVDGLLMDLLAEEVVRQ